MVAAMHISARLLLLLELWDQRCLYSKTITEVTLNCFFKTQAIPIPFDDDTSVFDTELWDPATGKFTVCPFTQNCLAPAQGPTRRSVALPNAPDAMNDVTLASCGAFALCECASRVSRCSGCQRNPITLQVLSPIAVGRNYHSVGLLLPDSRVFSGGGGLCGTCTCGPILLDRPAADAGLYFLHLMMSHRSTAFHRAAKGRPALHSRIAGLHGSDDAHIFCGWSPALDWTGH